MIHSTMTTAPKVVVYYSDGPNISRFLPLERNTLIYSPVGGTVANISGAFSVSGDKPYSITGGFLAIVSPGDVISAGDVIGVINMDPHDSRGISVTFDSGVDASSLTGMPYITDRAPSVSWLYNSNIYNNTPGGAITRLAGKCSVQLVYFVNGITSVFAKPAMEIRYIDRGTPFSGPYPSGGNVKPVSGWYYSATLEDYAGEAIYESCVLTARYDPSDGASGEAATVKWVSGGDYNLTTDHESNYKTLQIVPEPTTLRGSTTKRGFVLLPRYDYGNLPCYSFGEDHFADGSYLNSFYVDYVSGMQPITRSPLLYPLKQDLTIGPGELDIWEYSGKISVTNHSSGVSVSPPYKSLGGYLVNWSAYTLYNFGTSFADVEHTAESLRGYVYSGRKGDIDPGAKTVDSIIPILMMLSSHGASLANISNFGKYINKC